MDQETKLREYWSRQDYQKKHALAREIVVSRLRELDEQYRAQNGHGFIRFIETRMKTPESICEKLRRKGYEIDFDTAAEKLNDISGVRCICYCVKEVYWIARQIGKTDAYTVIKAKDYIRKPKKNGYESYHIVLDIPMSYHDCTEPVRVELQLRTLIMDAWAGMDNRIAYKKNRDLPPELQKRIYKYAKIGRRMDKLIQRMLDDVKDLSGEDAP